MSVKLFRERDAGLLDVVDHRGQNAARRVVLEEPNRLTNDFRIDLVAQIGDGGVANVLNFSYAKVFRDAFGNVKHNEGQAENSPNVVNVGRKELIQINGTSARDGKERELRTGRRGGQYVIPRDPRHEGDETIGYGDESDKNNAHAQAESVRPHIAEQPL